MGEFCGLYYTMPDGCHQYPILVLNAFRKQHRFAHLLPRWKRISREGRMGGNLPIPGAGASDTRTLVRNPVLFKAADRVR